jgi:hypothetical protein
VTVLRWWPVVAALTLAGPQPATQLEAGMLLVYESNGAAQPPWTVDSVHLGAPLLPGAECAVVHLRRRADRSEENRHCVARDTLYRSDAAGGPWTISRPVGPGMVWSARQANGDSVRYETGTNATETVSGLAIPVVHTTVTTTDSLGRPKRRLRERYALTLVTATGGVFETPDTNRPGGWVPAQRFELRAITLGR